MNPFLHAAETGQASTLAELLRAGADPLQTNRYERTALHLAAMGNHMEALHLLIRVCPLEARDTKGFTAIGLAAERGRAEALQCLIDAGAETKTPMGPFEYTLLMFAAESCSMACVEAALAVSMETVNVQNLLGDTALMLAIREKTFSPQSLQCTRRLLPLSNTQLKNFAEDDALSRAASVAHTEIVSLLLSAQSSWSQESLDKAIQKAIRICTDPLEWDPLHFESLDVLLEKGPAAVLQTQKVKQWIADGLLPRAHARGERASLEEAVLLNAATATPPSKDKSLESSGHVLCASEGSRLGSEAPPIQKENPTGTGEGRSKSPASRRL